jgi:hypothetical protein
LIQFQDYKLRLIISGGQAGADQGGLAAAKVFNVATGGYCPDQFKTVHGPNPALGLNFGLIPAGTYQRRTELNVKLADATFRFASNLNSPGEVLTLACINKFAKPYRDVQLPCADPLATSKQLADFIEKNQVWTLNVAGNADRDEQFGRHYTQTMGLMLLVLDTLEKRGLLATQEQQNVN